MEDLVPYKGGCVCANNDRILSDSRRGFGPIPRKSHFRHFLPKWALTNTHSVRLLIDI